MMPSDPNTPLFNKWNEDTEKQKKLTEILSDPVFLEALAVVQELNTPIAGAAEVQSAAMAYSQTVGYNQAVRNLRGLQTQSVLQKPPVISKPWANQQRMDEYGIDPDKVSSTGLVEEN